MGKKKSPDQAWKTEFIRRANQPALSGDYLKAVAIAKEGLREFPDEFVCQYHYAKLLGDYADELPPAKKKKLKNEAIRILRPLMRKMRGVPAATRFGACLNYYYQSEGWLGMYNFSRRFRFDKQKSWYGQGLASGLIAFDLDTAGKSARARTWAKKSVQAWKKYDLAKDPYYFAHYSAAKSFALAGESTAAMKHLKRAAVLAKRPISDWEFADVVKILDR